MDAATNPRQLILPFLAPFYRALEPLGYPLIRLTTGAILVPHGWAKLFEGGSTALAHGHSLSSLGLQPIWLWAWAVGCVEFFGAIFVAVGFLTRLAAASIAVEMLVITFAFQWKNGYLWTHHGYEFSLMWALICIGVALRGPENLSIDRWLGWDL